MRRIKITIEYVGTNYVGFQVQPKGTSIQGEVEQAIQKVVGHAVKVVPSGRTDAGVHAIAQVAHFDTTNSSVSMDNIVRGANINLPPDIKLVAAEEVSKTFHAKNTAKKKTYQYVCYLSRTELPLFENRAMQVGFIPNIAEIEKAAKHLVGKHDFSSFCAANSGRTDFVRNVLSINIKKVTTFSCPMLIFEITGEGFLYKMVRNIVGTLLEVGRGKRAPQEVKEILDSRDRKRAGRCAPACGLYLKVVTY